MVKLPNYDENPTDVDLSIHVCQDAGFTISKVEEKEGNDNHKGYVNFTLKITDHDNEDMVGREFRTTFWNPNPEKSTKLQLQNNVARWKQLCLATGELPEDGEIDPNDFHGCDFRGEIKLGKPNDEGVRYAELGAIHYAE